MSEKNYAGERTNPGDVERLMGGYDNGYGSVARSTDEPARLPSDIVTNELLPLSGRSFRAQPDYHVITPEIRKIMRRSGRLPALELHPLSEILANLDIPDPEAA